MTTLQPAPTPNPVLVQETLSPQPATLNSSTTLPACRESLSPPAAPQLIDTKPVPAAPSQVRKARRTGRVASLPKINRDMVNRMIHNGVPYKNIVGALDELGFTVTERNISNWATGGFLEWRAEQDLVTDEPPLLPPPSTSAFLAMTDREAAEQRQLENMVRLKATMQALTGQTKNDSRAPQPALPAGSPTVAPKNPLSGTQSACPKPGRAVLAVCKDPKPPR